jgi:hypothetical protein
MEVLTHPSNPPADAVDFRTQQSEILDIAHWKQTSKPNYQDTPDTAYKVFKIGNDYFVTWAGRKGICK